MSESLKNCGRIYPKGENHPSFRVDKPKCIDCGIKIGYYNQYKRCRKCTRKYRIENNLYKSREYHYIRMSPEFKEWRISVFSTDNYTCQRCGKRGHELRPHHILNFSEYPEERFNPNNGITFCNKCHKWFHNIYGQKHNNSIQVKDFLGCG